MSKEYHTRLLTENEYMEWDQLVEASPGGTVYNTSWWGGYDCTTQRGQDGDGRLLCR